MPNVTSSVDTELVGPHVANVTEQLRAAAVEDLGREDRGSGFEIYRKEIAEETFKTVASYEREIMDLDKAA
jgi:hypothetical protein